MAGIIGYGVYIPRYRIKQADAAIPWGGFGAGERSVCGLDEDVISMAAEASEKAMKHAGIDPAQIGAIHIGTASSPYLEQYIAPILAETLALKPEATKLDYCNSVNSVAAALQACLDAIEAKRIKAGIVIGTENRVAGPGSEGEASFGAGAVAMVVGNEDTIADFEGVSTYATLFYDRWRAVADPWVSNYFDYRFAREFGYQKHIGEASKGLMKKIGRKPGDFSLAVFQQPDNRLPPLVARDVGINPKQLAPDLTATLGDLGSCSAFISLAGVLDKAQAGLRILVATYGSGSSNAISLVVNNHIEAKRGRSVPLEKYVNRKAYVDYPAYLRLTGILKRVPY